MVRLIPLLMHGCEPVVRHLVDPQQSESLVMSNYSESGSEGSVNGLSYEAVLKVFSEQSLFENKTWRYSPEAFPLDAKQVAEIELIGQACYDFYRAHETLYIRSVTDKNLLRNRELKLGSTVTIELTNVVPAERRLEFVVI